MSMPILWEGGEEGAISPETPLVGAFHVFQFQLRSRAASMVALVSFFPVRRPSFPCGVLCSRAARCVPPCTISFRSVAKNNPCIFLPNKKKQKAACKENPAFPRGFSVYLNSTNFWFVFSQTNASILASSW